MWLAGTVIAIRAPTYRSTFYAHFGSPPLRGAWAAAALGPLRLGVGALLRSYTVLAMQPFWAAAARLGTGMLWPHARLGGPVPWAPATLTMVPRRCHYGVPLRPRGIGVFLFVWSSTLMPLFLSASFSMVRFFIVAPSQLAICIFTLVLLVAAAIPWLRRASLRVPSWPRLADTCSCFPWHPASSDRLRASCPSAA